MSQSELRNPGNHADYWLLCVGFQSGIKGVYKPFPTGFTNDYKSYQCAINMNECVSAHIAHNISGGGLWYGMNMRAFFKFSFEINIADVPVLWDGPYAHEQAGFVLMNCELLRRTGSLLPGWMEEEEIFMVRQRLWTCENYGCVLELKEFLAICLAILQLNINSTFNVVQLFFYLRK